MNKEIIEFKSMPYIFQKEKDGIKNNTVRKVPIGIDRWNLIYRWIVINDYGYIKIINKVTNEFFIRKIIDITVYENLYIITWRN